MGKGGEGRQVPVKDGLMKRISSSGKLKSISSVADDLLVLKSIWFNKASGDDHAERLENFYGPQAEACECTLHARCITASAGPGLHALTLASAVQMITSAQSSCGDASPCWRHALRGLLRGVIWSGLTLVAAPG